MSSTPPNWPLPASPINARPTSGHSSHTRNASAEQKRLSAIAEDRQMPPSRFSEGSTAPSSMPVPSSPPSATRGTFGRAWRDKPPRASSESVPPQYTLWDVTGPKGEKLRDLRNNRYVARRGGWKRLVCVIFCLVALAVGLGVGLGVGLARKNDYSDDEASPASPSGTASPNATAFPVGNYTFAGSLASVSTGCTSNPSTFLCWPYTTYSASASNSNVTFNWAIEESGSTLSVSSSNNPFAITFANATLSHHDAGTPTERYAFSVQLDKYVIPTGPIDDSGSLAACWFNGTTLAGNLWARRAPSSPMNSSAASAAADAQSGWPDWQFAFDVNQTISGGTNVPECYQQTNDGGLGSRITSGLTAEPDSQTCGCYWRNYNL